MSTVSIKEVAGLMPLTAKWVKQQRERWGDDHVTDQIRRAIRGERNRFYAMERGHVFGTTFDFTEKGIYLFNGLGLAGASFVACMREPGEDGGADMAAGVAVQEVVANGAH